MIFKAKKLSTMVLAGLTACLALIFLVTIIVVLLVLTHISMQQTEKSLRTTANDIHKTYQGSADERLDLICDIVVKSLGSADLPHTQEELLLCMQNCKAVEINIVNRDGIIIQSTDQSLIGHDFHDSEYTREFLALLDAKNRHVFLAQDFRPDVTKQKLQHDNAEEVQRKFVAHSFRDGSGIIELGIDKNTYDALLETMSIDMTTNWHFSVGGHIIVADKNNRVISNLDDEFLGKNLAEIGFDMEELEEDIQSNSLSMQRIMGERSLCLAFREQQGHLMICIIPLWASMLARDTTFLFLCGAMLLIFLAQGIILHRLLKKNVIRKIQCVNESLQRISDGNLDEVVALKGAVEFQELAAGINTTVDSLKQYTADAAARLGKELMYARAIQTSILPSVFPPFPTHQEFDVFASMKAAKEVGGDFYDFFFVSRNRVAFLVADVSGKGFPAALKMMHTKTLLKNYAQADRPLAEVFSRVNRELCEGNSEMVFVTAWMGILDVNTGELHVINAGHVRPVFYRQETGRWAFQNCDANLVLGVMKDYPFKQAQFQLHPGDKIFLYTDGITEAMNTQGELFGEARLLEILEKNMEEHRNSGNSPTAQEICAAVKTGVDAFVDGAPQADDITMLTWCVQELLNNPANQS